MYQIRIDATSPYNLRLPRDYQPQEIVGLAQKFVAYESTRAEVQRTPLTHRLATLLDEVTPCYQERDSGERQRTAASEAVKRLDHEAKTLINHLWNMMNYLFKATPEQAQAWGFEVRQVTGRIIRPQSRPKRLDLLTSYVAYEESRPDHQRFSLPDLAEVRRVRDGLAGNLSARDAGRTQREVCLIAGEALTNQMLNHLQAAVVHLLAVEYGYKLSPDLEKWGFEVVLVRHGNGHSRTNGHGNGHSQANSHSDNGNGSKGVDNDTAQ